MALNVSAWSIRQPTPAIVFSLIFTLLGYISFTKLPITRLPSADIPIISVVITQFGAAPAELEAQVTRTIEDAASGVSGVNHIKSSITDGMSLTVIEFRLDADSDRALNDIKDAVTRARGSLPPTINEPLIQRVDVVGLPIVTYAAIAPGKTPEQLSWFVDDVVKRALQGVRGVAGVERIGGVDREILVSLDPDRLQAIGLTAYDVSRMLRGSIVDLAGGRAEVGGRDQAIRTLAGAKSLDQLAGTMIVLPSGGEVRLDDLGVVTDTIVEPRSFARLNSEPTVAFSVTRAKGFSDVVVADAVEKKIKSIKNANPEIELKLIDSSVTYTHGNYEKAIETLFEGAALAVIVVLLFLRDIRATLIAAVTLPLSILPAFWAMDIMGFTLNLVSFLAITLSTGIIVDDAIVEIENIERHIHMGKSPYQAAMDAADEIGLAVIAISLTIIAVFIPASFMGSAVGQFFKQFGVTVSVQVFFSLLAARFITPVLAAYFLKPKPHKEKPVGVVMRTYAGVVKWSVHHSFMTVMIGLLLFAGAVVIGQSLKSTLIPAQDTARSQLAIELPAGSQLTETESVTEDIVKRLRGRPEIKSIFVIGGSIPRGPAEVRNGSLTISYVTKEERKSTLRDLERAIAKELESIPDIRYWFLDENGARGVSYVVTGKDIATVKNVAAELANQMKRIPFLVNVVSSAALDRPELRIRPRNDLAMRLGVSTEALSTSIRVATIGDFGPALARFDAGDRLIPIRVQLEDSARTDLQVLEQLRVPMGRGGGVPLQSVADIKFEQGPNSISRQDRERQATVAADLTGDAVIGDALKAIDALPVMKGLPPGFSAIAAGDAEQMKETASDFAEAMRNGLMIVYALLVLLFGSFLQPITILFSLPLSAVGAFIALLVTNNPTSIPVYIGLLMLMGIVTKNAIMLVDFAIEMIAHGAERKQAIVEAGVKRARPIVMTTIAMAAGMLPSALAVGAGGEFRSPMAIAVMGGLVVSTLLSLVFVPAFFVVMDDLGRLIWRVFAKLLLPAEGIDTSGAAAAASHTVPTITTARAETPHS